MRIVCALGGNALLRRGEPMTAENQLANIRRAAGVLTDLIAEGHSLVITHGSGPQVGLLALQAAMSTDHSFPLDVLDAESAGMIGYVLERELGNLNAGKLFATLLTQVKVDAADPAFSQPTKPIGPLYDEAAGRKLATERGWCVAPEGDKWRRVVASPRPLAILEAEVLNFLVEHAVIVICAGGGGIPVAQLKTGAFVGVEAVVDKDSASSLLARQLNADLLLMLTDVDAVYSDWGTPRAHPLKTTTISQLSGMSFAPGSMEPKVSAAIEFCASTGNRAAIGKLEHAVAILGGRSGTQIQAD